MLEVSIYDLLNPDAEVEVIATDYVSLVSDGTYGPPPVVAPTKDRPRPLASVGETVLYINPRVVPLFEIRRVS